MSKTTERITSLAPLEMIDVVIEYFSRPGAKLSIIDDSKQCRYRNEVGRKCAVGVFIDDCDYSETIEGKSLDLIDGVYNVSNELILTSDHDKGRVLCHMQALHDNSTSVDKLLEVLFTLRERVVAYGVPEFLD